MLALCQHIPFTQTSLELALLSAPCFSSRYVHWKPQTRLEEAATGADRQHHPLRCIDSDVRYPRAASKQTAGCRQQTQRRY